MDRRLLLGLFVLGLIVPLGASCSCLQQSPEQAINMSSAVFSGTVTETVSRPSGRVAVTIGVDTVWKGEVSRTMVVTTPGSSAACGYNFGEGRSYLVYANGDPPSVSLCSRTAPIQQASDDLDVLGAGSAPEGFSNAPGQYVMVRYGGGLILAGIVLLGIVFVYRKRLLGIIRGSDTADDEG